MTDAVTPTPPPESVVVPRERLEPFVQYAKVVGTDTLGRMSPDSIVIATATGSWSRPASITKGDVMRLATAALAAAPVSPPAPDALSDGLREALRIARQYVVDDVKRKPTEYDPSVDLARIDAALSAPAAKAAAPVPVARVVNDNRPGNTAIVAVVLDPPTLAVGTLLYDRPLNHARELVDAYAAGLRDAGKGPVPVAPGWAPKKLDWTETAKGIFLAEGFGYQAYDIMQTGKAFRLTHPDIVGGVYSRLELAQAAAQYHYDSCYAEGGRRVRECADAPARDGDEPEVCVACWEPLQDGELVLNDLDGGLIHKACCGPERESYTKGDGEPLDPDEPIPAGRVWQGSPARGGAVEHLALAALKLHVAYEAMPTDRGGKNGPKGKAWEAFITARTVALCTGAPS